MKNWDEALKNARTAMQEYAQKVGKITNEEQKTTESYHEIKIKLVSSTNSTEAKSKKLDNEIIPALSPNSQNEKDDLQMEANFPTGIEEEFGYYKQWEGWGRPLTEPINTVYHWKREKDNTVIEKKKVWKDNNQTPVNPQITDISDDMEIEENQRTNKSKKVETKATEVEVSQQQIQKQQFYKWFWYSLATLLVVAFAGWIWHGVKSGRWFRL